MYNNARPSVMNQVLNSSYSTRPVDVVLFGRWPTLDHLLLTLQIIISNAPVTYPRDQSSLDPKPFPQGGKGLVYIHGVHSGMHRMQHVICDHTTMYPLD